MSSSQHPIHTHSVEETQQAAATLASCAFPGLVIALDGDLGAGKTHFVQGFARGLKVEDAVTSPTFTVMCAYLDGEMPLYHFDLYRLEDPLELEDIAFYEHVEADGVSCIEWASKFADEMPDQTLWLTITTTEDGTRTITAKAASARASEALEAWIAKLA